MFKFKNNKKGFSLVELIVVIAIMAVIAIVLVPALLSYVEESRAGKDTKTTDELVSSVELALSEQDVYDELLEHAVEDNVSCYVDKLNESECTNRVVIKAATDGFSEWYEFGDDDRQADETPYFAGGNMRGVTITFSPVKSSNESEYILKDGIINKFVGRNTGYVYENGKIYNAIRSVMGDVMNNSSQTYRNSDFTIFIRMGTTGGNDAENQDAVKVYGQFNGTNLTSNDTNLYKLTADRQTGADGLVDFALNEKNNASKGQPDFSESAFMGTGVTTSTGTGNVVQKAPEDLTNTAIAFYCEDDASLNFTRIDEAVSVGDVVNGKTATAIYYNIETDMYQNSASVPWATYVEQIKSVKTLDWIKPIYTQCWFSNFKNCSNYDLSKLDTSITTSMFCMFQSAGSNCKNFTLNLTGLSADSLVNAQQMFHNVGFDSEKVYINLFKATKVQNMTAMFVYAGTNAESFKVKGLEDWDVSNVKSMNSTFNQTGYHSKTWSIGDLSGWNPKNCTNMEFMFCVAGYETPNWSIGDISNWDVSSVITMDRMFYYAGCGSESFNIGNIGKWNVGKVTNMNNMFCSGNPENNTEGAMNLNKNKEWYIGDLSNWNVSNVTTFSRMFGFAGYYVDEWSVGDLSKWNISNATTLASMFYKCATYAKTFDIGNIGKWNVSNVTSIGWMFMDAGHRATKMYIGDLSNWNTSKITSMYSAFNRLGYCATDWYIGDLSNWDVSKVTEMCWAFQQTGGQDTGPYSLGDLSGWDLSSCTNMNAMFNHAGMNASSFYIGDISGWNTSKVQIMDYAFREAGLNSDYHLDLSGWDVSAIIINPETGIVAHQNFNQRVEDKIIPPNWIN